MQLGFTYYAARLFFNYLLFVLGGRLRASGRHNVPPRGPYLLVANHMSMADSPAMMLALPPQRSHFWIANKYKTMPFFGPLAARLGGIFINREQIDRQAVRAALDLLRQGQVVGLAPEATRSPIGKIIRPRHGAAYLATRVKVPIVPVGMVGTEKLFGNFLSGRRTTIEVRFGPPIELPPLEGRIRQAELSAYTDYIMLHIARLLPSQYHGYYQWQEHPGLPIILRGEDPWPICLQLAGLDEREAENTSQ